MHRILVRTAAALAFLIPSGLFAALEGPALVAGAATAAFPVACHLSGTVTFTPALTKAGTITTNKAAVTTTKIMDGTLTGCLSSDGNGAPTSGTIPTLTIATPATKLGKVNGVMQYAIGYCPAFASTATLKSLKGLMITVTWTGGAGGTSTFVDKTPGVVANTFNEVGFSFLGGLGGGSYSQKALNQITAYLDSTASGALATACTYGQTVAGATIDSSQSTAIL